MRAIACVDMENGIGRDGDLLFKGFKPDLVLFRTFTELYGGTVVMGRKTYESLPKMQPLPNRTNIVISSKPVPEEFLWMTSIEDLIETYGCGNTMWVIGGGTIYKQLLPYTTEIILTRVLSADNHADTFFPLLNLDDWNVHNTGDNDWNGLIYRHEYYQRRRDVIRGSNDGAERLTFGDRFLTGEPTGENR